MWVRIAIAWCLFKVNGFLSWGPIQGMLEWALKVGTPKKRWPRWWISAL